MSVISKSLFPEAGGTMVREDDHRLLLYIV